MIRVGKTPVLSDEEARTLLEYITVDKVSGLRDRTLIGAMLYTFGRVGAVIAMDVEDYRISNHQRMFLLHEKGGKERWGPAHHRLVEYLGEYMDATGLWHTPKAPLFQALDITRRRLKGTRMSRQIVFQTVRRRDCRPLSTATVSAPPASPTTSPTVGASRTPAQSPRMSPLRRRGCMTARATGSPWTRSSGSGSEKVGLLCRV